MRRSYDGLAAMIRRELGGDPLSGQGFVFNRRLTQLKCLYFDSGSYCVWAKRLERGRFAAQCARQLHQVSAIFRLNAWYQVTLLLVLGYIELLEWNKGSAMRTPC